MLPPVTRLGNRPPKFVGVYRTRDKTEREEGRGVREKGEGGWIRNAYTRRSWNEDRRAEIAWKDYRWERVNRRIEEEVDGEEIGERRGFLASNHGNVSMLPFLVEGEGTMFINKKESRNTERHSFSSFSERFWRTSFGFYRKPSLPQKTNLDRKCYFIIVWI